MVPDHVPSPDRQAEVIGWAAEVVIAALLGGAYRHRRAFGDTNGNVRVVSEDDVVQGLGAGYRRQLARSPHAPVFAKQPCNGELSPGPSLAAPEEADIDIQLTPHDEARVVDVRVKIEPEPLVLHAIQIAGVLCRNGRTIDSSYGTGTQTSHWYGAAGQRNRQRKNQKQARAT